VECLGGCGGAPTMQVDHHFEENLTPDRVDQILGALRSQPTPHEGLAVEAGGAAGGSAGAQKARRRGVPAATGPAPTELTSAAPEAESTGATPPATTGPAPTAPPSQAEEAPTADAKPRTRRPRKAPQ
jgi:hypothetical protein